MYTTSNFRYLRISKARILPVNLLLSKEDLEWFNDYTFQEILSVLKPLLLGRIELYEQGHIAKKSIAPTTYNNINQNLDDGLDDAGVIFGGRDESATSTAQGSGSEATPGTNLSKGKRRRGGAEAVGGANGNKSDRPQFSVRYGMRSITNSERGGAILVADKMLGFAMVKKEQSDEAVMLEEVSQRSRTDLVALEGETGSGVAKNIGDVAIREEDESDNLRVSDFQRSKGDEDEDDAMQEDGDGGDGDYQDLRGSKRKKSARNTKHKGKGNRSKSDNDMSQSQSDRKPTLQINYSPLKLYPQTLYIVVRTLGSSNPNDAAPTLPFTVSVDTAASSSSSGGPADKLPGEQESEDSLFPPGLDYFLS
ncbi:hypothetical protein BGX26_004410 [Mortierella sp. AD094]|nr:hypothetical protein BGX26_004410 [Mortierella sp. AD094]